jgi:hypothetical protein
MPVPTVKADMSGANSLAAVGDTLASLGQTADRVQAVRAQRENAKKQADETAAADLAMEWKSRNEAKRDEFKLKAIGQNTYDAYDSFTKGLETDTGDDLLEGKSEGVRTEFNRRATMYRRDIQAAADQHATFEHRRYTLNVAGKEMETASGQAALALARGDNEAYAGYMAQAGVAGRRVEEATGVKMDADGLVTKSRYDALRVLNQESPDEAVKFFDANQKQFGKYADDAARVVAGSQNKVWARDTAQKFGAVAVDPTTGLTNWNAIYEGAPKVEGASPERLAILNERISAMQADENRRRTDTGQKAKALAQEAVMRSKADVDALKANPEFQQAIMFAHDEQRPAIMAALNDATNNNDLLQLQLMGTYGTREQKDAFLAEHKDGFMKRQLSYRDMQSMNAVAESIVKSQGEDLETLAASVVRRTWLRSGKKVPSATEPGSEEYQLFMNEAQTLADDVRRDKTRDPKKVGDVEAVYAENYGTTIDVIGGSTLRQIIGGSTEKVNARRAYDARFPDGISPELVYDAKISPNDSPVERMVKVTAFERMEALKVAVQKEREQEKAAAQAREAEEAAKNMTLEERNKAYYAEFDRWKAHRAQFQGR